MGHQRGAPVGTKALNASLAALVQAVDASRGASGPASTSQAAPRPAGKGDPRFVGNWRMVSFVNIGDQGASTPSRYTGGRIMYDAAGQMAAQLTYADRARLSSPATEAARAVAYGSFLSYYGAYEIDEAIGRVTHHVEASTNPNWPGTDLIRYFEFAAGGDTLKLSIRNASGHTTGTLTWARIR
jgi:hypothetical protein